MLFLRFLLLAYVFILNFILIQKNQKIYDFHSLRVYKKVTRIATGMEDLIKKSKKIINSRQNTILSAASVITAMIILSQIFGLIRQWVILRFLGSESFSLYLAAFRLPDLVFEVFAFGAFSSALIPVFSRYLKKNKKEAWDIASRVINIGLLIFFVLAIIFGIFSHQFYSVVAFGFTLSQISLVSRVARVIFFAEGLFIVSYVITGVLESSRRFLIPALAPVLYNIGIILGTIFFADTLGVYAPAIGVIIGAVLHLGIQLPVAFGLGFRFSFNFKANNGVREIGKMAAPRFIDLTALQIQKSAELFFSSIMSVASYGFLNLAYSLQAIPSTLFGVSLAKAALVSLSYQEENASFRKTFLKTLNQMMFLIIPISVFLVVLRIPVVRLTFGTSQSLDWNATVQIGMVLSYFAIGIPLQSALALISRAFYARHDAKTPVIFQVLDVFATLILETVFVFLMHLPLWSIAFANTLAAFIQVGGLYIILMKKIGDGKSFLLLPIIKSTIFSLISGILMYFSLKLFDRSVWIQKIPILGKVVPENIPFDRFVLDTSYTLNLIILTTVVSIFGCIIYIFLSWISKSEELAAIVRLITRHKIKFATTKKEPLTVEPEV